MSGFEHVSPGDKWQPSSIEINAMKDVARAYQGGAGVTSPGGVQAGWKLQPSCVRVRNATGGARDRYTAFSLGSPRWVIDDAQYSLPDLVWDLVAFDANSPPAVLQQPLKTNEIGYACTSGPTLLKVTGDGAGTDRSGTPNSSGVVVPANQGPVQFAHDRPTGGGYVLALLGVSQNTGAAGLARLAANVGAATYSFDSGGQIVSVSCPSVNANPFVLGSSIAAPIDTGTTFVVRNTMPIPLENGSVIQWKLNLLGQRMIDVWVCGSGGFAGPPEPEPEPL